MLQSLAQFEKGLTKHIILTFEELFSKAEVHEEDVITKHLQFEDIELGMNLRDSKLIKLKYPQLSTERNLIKYAILSWFLPPMTKFELQENLRIKAHSQRYVKVGVYLHSYEFCLWALYQEFDYSKNDIFGNILQAGLYEIITNSDGEKKKVLKNDKVYLHLVSKPNPIRSERKRGYTDHGSRPTASEVNYKKVAEEYGEQSFLKVELKRASYELQKLNRILVLTMKIKGVT